MLIFVTVQLRNWSIDTSGKTVLAEIWLHANEVNNVMGASMFAPK